MSPTRSMVSAARTLARVDERIRAVLEDLKATWADVSSDPDGILGADDIPDLLLAAARGGKRFRPEMVHWGWSAAGAPPEVHPEMVDLATATELLHVFALIHDDVMDRSELRRGRPTVHASAREAHRHSGAHGDAAEFGNSMAILAGDLVHAQAEHLVAPLPRPVRTAWRRMTVELVLGQQRDLTGAALGRRDQAHALEVARLKSGAYTVAGPLRMGALLGGADDDLLRSLDQYAWHLGEAFQLRDDILGIWGDPGETGKSVEDDLTAGKATVVMALANEHLGTDARELLARSGTGQLGDEDLARLRVEMDRSGIRERVEDIIRDEVDAARRALRTGAVSEHGVDGLSELADRVAWRSA